MKKTETTLKGADSKTKREVAKSLRSSFQRKKALALQSISLADMSLGESKFFESCADNFLIKKSTDENGDVKTENGKDVTLSILHVIDLATGEEGEIVCGVVIAKALEPVLKKGLRFEIVRGKKVNRTVRWEVFELDEK